MLTKNGKRIEDENGNLIAVLTNTERKAERIQERHGVPAFVGLDLDVDQVEHLLPGGAVEMNLESDQTPVGIPDDLDALSRSQLDQLAASLGINLDEINGSGKNGNVIAADVKQAIEKTRSQEVPDADSPNEPAVPDPEDHTGIAD